MLRDAHDDSGLRLFQPRWAYSFVRSPLALLFVAHQSNS
jgi:hypothetical protein